jgi:molybdopterin-containing oxidoreductase family membrane subunit
MMRTTWPWVTGVILSLAAIAIGLYCYADHVEHGFIVSALRNPGQGGGAWGLAIMFYVYFVGVSFAGIVVAALARLFDLEVLRPVTRIAELLTITALIAGACAVMSDLGRPLDGLLKLPRYANPRSPFFGTFTLVVSGYLFSSLVYFFLAGRADAAKLRDRGLLYKLWASGYRDTPPERARHHKVSFVLALGILPLLVTAHSTLGFIFGIQSGRPGWYSALQAPAFVVMAGVSGIGAVILVTAGLRRMGKLDIPDASLRWLGNLLWVLSLVYLYFMLVEELTATYAAPEADREVAHAITMGPFAPLFWITVACLLLAFAIPFVLYLRKRTSVRALVIASAAANIAAILKRYLIVVPSQTHGALTPIVAGKPYVPTLAEYGVVLGLFGIVAFAVLVFVRIFPAVPSDHPSEDAPPRDLLRVGLTGLTVLTALGLIALGLADSFRLFSGRETDPRIPYSPLVFASGVIILFCAAIVYEVLPDARPARFGAPAAGTAPAKEEDHA